MCGGLRHPSSLFFFLLFWGGNNRGAPHTVKICAMQMDKTNPTSDQLDWKASGLMRPRRSISFLLSPKRLSESVSEVIEVIEPWLDLGGYVATGGGIEGSLATSSTLSCVFSIESHITKVVRGDNSLRLCRYVQHN